MGRNRGHVVNSFWDAEASGLAESDGGSGRTTAEIQTAATFTDAGWDFVDETANGTDDIWWILEGRDGPRLWWELPTEYVVLVVDDFESYSDEFLELIYRTWIDGLGFLLPEPGHPGNGTNAIVGHDFWCCPRPPDLPQEFMETTIVHGGRQSMPLYYENRFEPYCSEAERTFTTPRYWTPDGVAMRQDWAVDDADTLTLHFRGEASNSPEPLYVTIEDSAGHRVTVRHPDADAVLATEWQEWRISLADLQAAGVDVASVAKMIIGLGNRDNPEPGGGGDLMDIIYIDDIVVTNWVP